VNEGRRNEVKEVKEVKDQSATAGIVARTSVSIYVEWLPRSLDSAQGRRDDRKIVESAL
jgi:hypothetical protein